MAVWTGDADVGSAFAAAAGRMRFDGHLFFFFLEEEEEEEEDGEKKRSVRTDFPLNRDAWRSFRVSVKSGSAKVGTPEFERRIDVQLMRRAAEVFGFRLTFFPTKSGKKLFQQVGEAGYKL